MKKYKRVNLSKEPTLSQLERMSRNLRIRYNKTANISVQSTSYDHSRDEKVEYWLYVDHIYGKHLKSWQECFNKYKELMK